MDYQQLCYARVGGQGVGSGWQVLNASPGVSALARSVYPRLQSGNANTSADVPSEEGQLPQVLELRSEGELVFLTMVTYGVADELGRPSSFAHGLVFGRDEFERDPQLALCVRRTSFGHTPEDTLPERLRVSLAEPMGLALAREACGLDLTGHGSLLLCVCEALGLDGRLGRPFRILCDCEPRTIHAVLTCIYQSIPYGLRGRVSFSTFQTNGGLPVDVVFSKDDQGRGFDLARGAMRGGKRRGTGVAGPERRLPAFAAHVLRTGVSEGELSQYLGVLEDEVQTFCDPNEASVFAYEAAYDRLVKGGVIERLESYERPLDPESIVRRLLCSMSLPKSEDASRRAERDGLVSGALRDVVEHSVALDDWMYDEVAREAEDSKLDSLEDARFDYDTSVRFAGKTPEEGAAYLAQEYPDAASRSTAEFLRLRSALVGRPASKDVLIRYYEKLADELQGPGGPSLDDIRSFHDETAILEDSRIDERVAALCEAHAVARVVPDGDPAELDKAIKALFSQVELSEDAKARIRGAVAVAYWRSFSFKAFNFRWKTYKNSVVNQEDVCKGQQEYLAALLASRVGQYIIRTQYELLARSYRTLEKVMERLEGEKRVALRERLAAYLRKWARAGAHPQDFDTLCRVAQAICNPSEGMKVPQVSSTSPRGSDVQVVCNPSDNAKAYAYMLESGMLPDDPAALRAMLDHSRVLREDGERKCLLEQCKRMSRQRRSPVSKHAKDVARALRSHERESRRSRKPRHAEPVLRHGARREGRDVPANAGPGTLARLFGFGGRGDREPHREDIGTRGFEPPEGEDLTARRLNGLIKPTEVQGATGGSSDRVGSSGSHSIKGSRKQGSRDGKR